MQRPIERLALLLILSSAPCAGADTDTPSAPAASPAVLSAIGSTAVPADAGTQRQQALDRWEAGEREQAIGLMDQAIARFPEDADNFNTRGQMLGELARYDAAIADLRRVTEVAPDSDTHQVAELQFLADEARQEGQALAQTNRNLEAAAAYHRAAEFEQARDQPRMADLAAALKMAGALYHVSGRSDEAEPLLRKALDINQKALPAGHPEIANSLNNLAVVLRNTGRFTEAELLLSEALALFRNARPTAPSNIANGLNNLAVLMNTTGRYPEAESLLREALEIRRKILPARHPDLAPNLNNLAMALQNTGHFSEAEQLVREALAIDEKAYGREHSAVATELNNLATVLQAMGRLVEAELLFREALAIRQKALLREHPDIATSLNNLAVLLYIAGQFTESEALHREALAFRQKGLPAGHPDIAVSLTNLGLLLRETGRFAEAEPLLRKALAVDDKAYAREHSAVATDLNNLAMVLQDTGRYDEAEPLYREALAINKKAHGPEHPTVAINVNNLALLLQETGRFFEAQTLYCEALAIQQKILPAEHPDIALNLTNLGLLLDLTDRSSEAEPLYREALAIRQKVLPAGHPAIAFSLNNLAALLHTAGRSDEALPLFREALHHAHSGGAPKIQWLVQGNLAAFYATQNQRPLAIFFGKQAVNTLQAVRQNLQTAEQTTQRAFLKSKEGYYKALADLLIAEARLPEAQQVLEMLKEQEYFDFLRRDAGADPRQTQATLNPFEAEQARRFEVVAAPLRLRYREAETLRRIQESVRTPEEVQRLQALDDTLRQGQQALKGVFEQVQTAFADLSAEQQRQLTAQLRLPDDLRDLVGTLGQGVTLVQYLVLEDQLRILVTTPTGITPYQVPLQASVLNQAAYRFYRLLKHPGRDPRPAGKQLFDWLIAPVAAQLRQDGTQTLMVALDGILRYLPLAALSDGQHYLSETYALALYTAAAKDGLATPTPGPWQAVGLGVSAAHEGFKALPAVQDELEGIINQGPPDAAGVLPGALYLDQAFTRDTLHAALTRGYPVVHLSSHFAFRPGNEQQSFLLLGDGNHLDLGSLRTGDYRFAGVDLVTLSACDTALDSPGAKGQEIEGLGTLAQKQGAKGVIATLWPVADASTGLFMQQFYRLRQEQHLSKAEALRQAQLTLRTSPGTTASAARAEVVSLDPDDGAPEFPRDPAQPYAHPYYWAPFILMGNWL